MRAPATLLRIRRVQVPISVGVVVASFLATAVGSATSASAAVTSPPNLIVSGAGSQSSSPFHLRPGLAIFTVSATGRSTFSLYLENGKGVIQPWVGLTLPAPLRSGSGFDVVRSGTYRLALVTTGHWRVTITQPRSSPATGGLNAFSGSGPRVVGPIDSLNVKITMSLDEPGGKQIIETGQTVSVANEQELIVGSDSSWQSGCPTPPAGPYFLDIPENFAWTIVVGSDQPPWAVYTGGVPGALSGSVFVGGDHCPILLPSESN